MFVAYDPSAFSAPDATDALAERILEDLHRPSNTAEHVRYPGERTVETRRRNLREGIPVDPAIWESVQGL
jgi:3-dehydro-L-gulonate 2-dehydrogenase